MHIKKKIFLIFHTILWLEPAFATGERLIDAVMRSDFIFDKSTSNVPFFPLSYLNVSVQNDLEIDQNCNVVDCTFDYTSISQGFGLPVWIEQNNMLILGESLERDTLDFANSSTTINTAGLLAAWVSQPTPQWQAGGFIYGYQGIGGEVSTSTPSGIMSGVIARYRHEPEFHTYWGLVNLKEHNNNTIYPYLGFDWYLDKKWHISALIPWPTLNYAPTKNNLFKIGVLFSGSDWSSGNGDNISSNTFGKLDFGISWEQRLSNLIWSEVSIGHSGFGRLSIQSDADIDFESKIKGAPFFRFSINLRPE